MATLKLPEKQRLMTGKYRSILETLPRQEFKIRKLCTQDPRFHAICVDYEEAAAALRRWQNVGIKGEKMAQDFARLVGELESEILNLINSANAQQS